MTRTFDVVGGYVLTSDGPRPTKPDEGPRLNLQVGTPHGSQTVALTAAHAWELIQALQAFRSKVAR